MAATLTFPTSDPGIGTTKRKRYNTRRVDFGDGYSQRVADGLNNIREIWDVIFDNISDTLADTIEAFIDARNGDVEPFLWTPPHEATAKQYTASNFVRQLNSSVTSTLTVTFTQEFDL